MSSPSKVSPDQAVALARQAVASADFPRALAIAEALIQAGQLNFDLFQFFVRQACWGGQDELAERLVDKLIAKAPKMGFSWRVAYSLYVSKGDWNCCMKAIRNCRRFGDSAKEIDIFEAETQLRLMRPEKALVLLNQKFDGDLAVAAWKVRGPLLIMQGQHGALVDTLLPFLQSQSTHYLAHASLWKDLGVALDKLKRYDDAFSAFRCANEIEKRSYQVGDGRNRVRDLMAVWKSLFTREWVASWENSGGDSAAPVFLVGFPRSGTTLLEQVLDAHPDVVALEEKNILESCLNLAMATTGTLAGKTENLKGLPWRVSAEKSLRHLSAISEDTLQAWREYYWREVGRFVQVGSRTLIDKMPLDTIHIGFILRLFPNARFIVALRHPADCILSGYMQSFKMNGAMSSFLDIETAGAFYRDVMGLLAHYQTVFDLSSCMHFIKYEDVVADFNDQIGKLVGFLGLPWEEGVHNYAEHAKERGTLNTPSYQGVTKGIYSSSRFRWHHYDQYLAPALPHIRAACERFGYDIDVPEACDV